MPCEITISDFKRKTRIPKFESRSWFETFSWNMKHFNLSRVSNSWLLDLYTERTNHYTIQIQVTEELETTFFNCLCENPSLQLCKINSNSVSDQYAQFICFSLYVYLMCFQSIQCVSHWFMGRICIFVFMSYVFAYS